MRARHGASPDTFADIWPRIQQLAEDGVISIEGSAICVPDHARLLVRHVPAAFDAYLAESALAYSLAV